MVSEIIKSEVVKPKATDIPSYRDIKPESGMTVSEANKYWDIRFNGRAEVSDGYYIPYEKRLDRTPVTGDHLRGDWKGERGESRFIPSIETEKGKAAHDKLAEKGMDGIEYKYAEPDFSECAEATVEIDNMTENRGPYDDKDGNRQQGNFWQAEAKCAEQWNTDQREGKTDWSAKDVRDWRRANKYSWHERCDTRTMDLVPQEIHGYFTHSGGCWECKARDGANIGGVFDE